MFTIEFNETANASESRYYAMKNGEPVFGSDDYYTLMTWVNNQPA